MNPLIDQLAVAGIVAGALGFFAVRFFKKKNSGGACGGGCCAPKKR